MQKPNLPAPQNRDQVATYIAEMSSGLAELARGQDLRFLTYLLEMAALAAATGAGNDAKVRLAEKARTGKALPDKSM